MTVLFIEYPKCSTCRKARKWLDGRGIAYEDRDIVKENPTAGELAAWRAKGGLGLRKLFNTSGAKYRELGVKAQLDAGMSDERVYELLASDGMLVKRPILVLDDTVLVGFCEEEWEAALG